MEQTIWGDSKQYFSTFYLVQPLYQKHVLLVQVVDLDI